MATAPLFALLFLSNLQTALSFGLMLAIYFFYKIIFGWRIESPERIRIHLFGIILGGLLGILLAAFWLFPCLIEGSGRLGLTSEEAIKVAIPVASLFVEVKHLRYLTPLQRIWSEQYFLGFPLIILFLFRYEMTEIHIAGFAISVFSIVFVVALLIREQLKISHTRKLIDSDAQRFKGEVSTL